MDTIPIELLRVTFAQSVIATLATQLGAYLRLVGHPDLQFLDLLEALSRNAVIGDDAAARLQRRLKIANGDAPPVVSRAYWEQVLAARGIDPVEPFHPRQNQTPSHAAPAA